MLDVSRSMKRTFPYGVVSAKPAIRIKPGVKMAMNRNVLRSLGNPRYIQFWWSPLEKVLLIGNAPIKSHFSVEVSDYCYSPHGNTNLRSSVLVKAITDIAEWREHITYSLLGDYVPGLDMVAFRTDDAVEAEATVNA